MEPFKIYILGCGSALPTLHHNASSQVVEVRQKLFMVDCGEGTQMQLRRSHIRFLNIRCVFISHLHGDHCFGLVGMLSTFGMLGRTMPLHIYAPTDMEPLLALEKQLFLQGLTYEVVFHGVDTKTQKVVYEDRSLTVETLPLRHRVPCCGYLFREKPTLPHIRRDMIDYLNIPFSQINNIKNGADWTTEDGKTISNNRLVLTADAPRSYAYCSDTCYLPKLHERIKGVNLLYHESTYASDYPERAKKFFHSTSQQAAQVARDAGAGQLLLGHYSARYDNEQQLLEEARQIFPNSFLTDEGAVFDVK